MAAQPVSCLINFYPKNFSRKMCLSSITMEYKGMQGRLMVLEVISMEHLQ